MKLVFEKKWSYQLFCEADKYYLSVVVGTVGLNTIALQVSEQEVKAYQEQGVLYLDELANDISTHPGKYLERKLSL